MAPKFDLATPKGLAAFNGFMSSKSYLEGYSFSEADSAMYATCAVTPDSTKYPHLYRWFIHIAALVGTPGAAAPAAAPKGKAAKKPAKGGDDEMDDLFDDDEEEDKPKVSRAEALKAAKAEKDKKKKVERSQMVVEVKPWEADADLMALFKKIQQVPVKGCVWGEACNLVPVAFGVKKIVLSCVVEDEVCGMDDVTDAIEQFEDEVQSCDVTTMNRL